MNQQAKKLQCKSPYCLVTVNPRSEVTLQEFKKVIAKFVNKKTIPEWFKVFEVRKGDTGLHSHILLRYTAPPYDFKRSAKNTFKKVCDSENPSVLNFRFVEEGLLPDKVSYMLGNKQSKKLKGVEDTKLYRARNNLPDYEESSPPLTCRATVITQ